MEVRFDNLKEKVVLLFKECPTLDRVEEFSEAEIRKAVLEVTRLYAQSVDRELLNDKSGRKAEGLTVERRADRRSILTVNGELTYERTYYALRDGTYGYPVDTRARSAY